MLAALTDSEYTRNATPPITGLDLQLESCAHTAVSMLLQHIDEASPPAAPSFVRPTVRWRASTGNHLSKEVSHDR